MLYEVITDVEVRDAGMMPGAPQNLTDQHAGQRQIGRVFRLSGNLEQGIRTLDPLTNYIHF